MGHILVIVIVVLAVAYVGTTFYRRFKKQSACGCGCRGCCVDSSGNADTKRNAAV